MSLADNPQKQYERFKLEWMVSHGYGLGDLISALQEHIDFYKEEGAEALSTMPLQEIFREWESDIGFGSEIWPCFHEWQDCEGKEAASRGSGGHHKSSKSQNSKRKGNTHHER